MGEISLATFRPTRSDAAKASLTGTMAREACAGAPGAGGAALALPRALPGASAAAFAGGPADASASVPRFAAFRGAFLAAWARLLLPPLSILANLCPEQEQPNWRAGCNTERAALKAKLASNNALTTHTFEIQDLFESLDF